MSTVTWYYLEDEFTRLQVGNGFLGAFLWESDMSTTNPLYCVPVSVIQWIEDSEGNRILDMRGWGFLTGRTSFSRNMDETEAAKIQDSIGRRVATLMNNDVANAAFSDPIPSGATVSYYGVLDMQVCVPADWTDEQVVEFANASNPCGTEAGWHIRREGSDLILGDPERGPCNEVAGKVHIMLDA